MVVRLLEENDGGVAIEDSGYDPCDPCFGGRARLASRMQSAELCVVLDPETRGLACCSSRLEWDVSGSAGSP